MSEVFVIGGGPSLKGFDFNKLKNKTTIVVNNALKYVPNPNYYITVDYFHLTKGLGLSMNKIKSFNNTKKYFVAQINNLTKVGNSYVDKYKTKFDLSAMDEVVEAKYAINPTTGFGLDFKSFSHGCNSGFCGAQLALLLGFDKINLLGFDLSGGADLKSIHFYNSEKINVNRFNSSMNRYASMFCKAFGLLPQKYTCRFVNYSKNSPLAKILPTENLDKL